MTHEYKLLYGDTPEALSAQVNEALADGWDLWGNPFWARVPGYYSIGEVNKYCQAVVRLRETEVSDVEKVAYKPVGYTVQVPVLEEFSPKVISVVKEQPVVLWSRLPECTCHGTGGEDPECEFHKMYPSMNLRF